MQLVLLLAGAGKRLRPLTLTRPKTLIQLAGKPVLGHMLDRILARAPVDELIVVCSPQHMRQIREYLGDNYRLKTVFVEQPTPRGQAHAVYLARRHLHGAFLIAFGDTIVDIRVPIIPADSQADGIIFVKQVEDARSHGAVLVREGTVARIAEKPTTPLSDKIATGLYFVVNSSLFLDSLEAVVTRAPGRMSEIFLAEVLQSMIEGEAVLQAVEVERWEDCGQPMNLLRAHRYVLECVSEREAERTNVQVNPPVFIAPTALVEHSVIGPYVSVEDGCIVRGSVLKDCVLGAGSTVEDSELNNSLVGHASYLRLAKGAGNLVLGDHSRVTYDP